MSEFQPKTFQSKYYHNEHSRQRDEFLIEQFGEEWLAAKKAQGLFGGDWPEEKVGTLKEPDADGDWRSGYIDPETGEKTVIGEEVFIDASES